MNTVKKVVVTYGDGSEATYTGSPVGLSSLPTCSSDEQDQADQAKRDAAKDASGDLTDERKISSPEEVKTEEAPVKEDEIVEEETLITQEDLDANPELVNLGLKIGDAFPLGPENKEEAEVSA